MKKYLISLIALIIAINGFAKVSLLDSYNLNRVTKKLRFSSVNPSLVVSAPSKSTIPTANSL